MSSSMDQGIGRLADAQHGVVTRRQLLSLGLGAGALEHRLRTRRLVRLHRGVYAVGHRALAPRGHQLAAVLACGPGAVLSHKSAGALWELLVTAQLRIDVTVPGTSRAPRRGRIRLHRARELVEEDLAEVDGIPVTSPARTLLDLAGTLNRAQLLRAVEQSQRCGRLNLPAIERVIGRHPTRRGAGQLRALLRQYVGPVPVRSELERRFLELATDSGLPTPQVNVKVAGLEVDVYWPQWRLVVELDGRAFHSDPRSFERDRVRDARLQRARCRVLRVTHLRVSTAAAGVIDDVRALAALSGSDGRSTALDAPTA